MRNLTRLTRMFFCCLDTKATDSSGEDDSDDEDINGALEVRLILYSSKQYFKDILFYSFYSIIGKVSFHKPDC